MKIVILIAALFVAAVLAKEDATAAAKAPKSVENKSKNVTQKLSEREKRNLGDFGNYGQTPISDRRISNGYSNGHYGHYPTNYIHQNPNHQRYYGYDTIDTSSNYISHHHLPQQQPHQHQQPQYLEAPEPIIEIIIKESNESLPELAQPAPAAYGPKKKEQVQVFYVKYKKDEHDGLVVDNPVPALSPESHHQESEDYHEIVNDEPIIVTPNPIPLRTTTLRTIIHPDSEKYHSNSGIHVSFGTEDKYQTGHALQEENSESNIQPVLLPRPEALVQPPPHPNNLQFGQQQKIEQNHQFQQKFDQFSNQQTRIVNNFPSGPAAPPPQQQHQQPPPQLQHHQQPPQPIQNHNFRPPNFAPPQQQQQQQQPQQGPPLSHQLQLPYQNTPTRPFNNNHGPPPPPPPQSNFFQQQASNNNYRPSQQQPPAPQQVQPLHRPQFVQGPIAPPPPPPLPQASAQQQQIRFAGQQQSHQFQQQQQRGGFNQQQLHHQQHQQQQPQQHKPIPIPLHNLNQQPPLNRQVPLPPSPPQQAPQFNQPFNNFQQNFKQQPPLPKPIQHFRQKPAGPPPPQPPPQSVPQQQQQQQQQQVNHQRFVQNQQYNNHQQNYYSQQQPIVQGGLVQQAAPNLGPTASLTEHEQNLKHVLPIGGELIQSVSKYEQHITETVNSPPQQYNLQPQAQHFPQQQVSQSTARPITAAPPNIGPLATTIGHLNVPQPQALHQHQPTQPQHHHHQQQQHQQQQQQPSQANYNQLVSGQLFREQVQQQFGQYNHGEKPQVIPNSQPVEVKHRPQQNVKNGQSVSTHYSEVFPTFEQEQKKYNNQNFLSGRNTNNLPTDEKSVSSIAPGPTPTTARPASVSPSSPAISSSTKKPLNIALPDEVPDDLRQQLLSSGILDNADISVLDYDKIGETALENLPPEHLANFFNAGGGSQIAGSNNVVSIVKPNGEKVTDKDIIDEHSKKLYPKSSTLPKKQNVDLKVVRFDSNSQKTVSDKYIKEDSTVLSSVDISDQIYNRYLPLRINGAQFPIPDVEELKGKKISSVVVLAPVDNIMNKNDENVENDEADVDAESNDGEGADDAARYERDVLDSKLVKFLAGDALKQLIKKPSAENYKRWLEKEGKSDVDLQSVVLLVTKNNDDEQEIFMYDITTKSVSKLSGDLSKAFVDVAAENAEQNASQADSMDATTSFSDSSLVEQMVQKLREKNASNKAAEQNFSDLSSDEDSEQQPSQQVETVVKYEPNANPSTNAHHQENRVLISSGYSVIKN